MAVTNKNLSKHLSTAVLGLAISIGMFAFGYAMIPLYYKFCAAFGIGVASSEVLKVTTTPKLAREIRVEFDANSHNSLVAMQPAQRIANLKTGTAYSMTYEIRNLTEEPVTGTAVPTYLPQGIAQWFTKLQCFCFAELELQPGEVILSPVVFILERELPEQVNTVALSYTFHPEQKPHLHRD